MTIKKRNAHPYSNAEALAHVQRVDFFDRVSFRCNGHGTDLELDLGALKMLAQNVRLTPRRIEHDPSWKSLVEVFRPSREWFVEFQKQIGTRFRVEASYAEVARDYVTRFRAEARAIRRSILRNTIHHYASHDAVVDRNSIRIKLRRNAVFSIYADKPHRLEGSMNGAPCVHFELRLKGKPNLRAVGLLKPLDFVAIDLPRFWEEHLQFFALPADKTKLGRLTVKGQKQYSASALRKRVDTASSPFILHNLHRKHSVLRDRLPRITLAEWEAAVPLDRLGI